MFPHPHQAAVSMTYDDAVSVHLDHAMPDLEAAGLRGTFYIPTRKSDAWSSRPAEWRAAAQRGHEIANHTQFHPCSRSFPWVPAGYGLEDYDLARIERELCQASADIRAITGVQSPHSFAYTCCQDWVGEQHASFRPIADRLFPVSRGGPQPGEPRFATADPASCDFPFIPSWVLDESAQLEQVLSLIDQTVEQRQWAVLMFHGVGGGHNINVSRSMHQAICAHIASRRPRLWCGTMVDVAMQIRTAARRPWTA